MLDFNIWMTINDVNMTSWVQLEGSWIVVENELFWLSCNELHCIYGELQLYNSCNLYVRIHAI
jgi:phosphatidate phosphatase PAH1